MESLKEFTHDCWRTTSSYVRRNRFNIMFLIMGVFIIIFSLRYGTRFLNGLLEDIWEKRKELEEKRKAIEEKIAKNNLEKKLIESQKEENDEKFKRALDKERERWEKREGKVNEKFEKLKEKLDQGKLNEVAKELGQNMVAVIE